MALQCSLAGCAMSVDNSLVEFENKGRFYCYESQLLHMKDVENVAHVDHPVYAKTPDNVNQCPVCKNRLKFLVYQANTGHQLFDYYRKTYRAQANATKVARAYLVAAKSSAVFPYFMQNSEAEYPENAISHILPPISKPQTTEH